MSGLRGRVGKKVGRHLATGMVLAGGGLIAFGAALIFTPAGWIVGGLVVGAVGALLVEVP